MVKGDFKALNMLCNWFWKLWACQQVIKKYKCLQKKKKCIDITKIWSWHCARKKKKEVEKNKSEIKHLGLVENRSRPRIKGQVDHPCS